MALGAARPTLSIDPRHRPLESWPVARPWAVNGTLASTLGPVAARPQPELDAPRGEAAKGLAALVAQRHELDARLNAIDLDQRQATEDVERLSGELANLERRAASGEQVSAKARTEAEAKLTKARLRHGEPWAERRAGVQAAIRDADRDVRQYATEHLTELLAELHEDGEAAAEDVNRACHALGEAYLRRMEVERQVIALAGVVAIARPDVARTRAEPVLSEARRLLAEGGEAAPILSVEQTPTVIAADVA
jgi:chromosome segregation ATPase